MLIAASDRDGGELTSLRRTKTPVVSADPLSIGRTRLTVLVASSIPGYSRIVRHERDGFLVPPRDVSAWTRALRLLVDDPVRRHRMGSLGVADAARYDWNRVASEMLEIYAEAIWRRRRGLVAADATMRGAVARTYPA